MKVILLSIGKFHIYGYGLMIALALIISIGFALWRSKKYGVDGDILFNGVLFGVIFGFLGSKLTYYLVEIRNVIQDPSMLLNFGSGFVVYGGITFGVLAPYVYYRFVKKQDAVKYLDFAMPSIAMGQGIGRIGCFLAGCCYGKEAPVGAWFGVTFPEGCSAPAGVALYPTQLMMSLGDLILMALLLVLLDREKFRGQVIAVYMILYSIGRFVVEMFRNDPRGSVGALSTSQFLAIFAFAAGAALYIFFRVKKGEPIKRIAVEKTEKESEAT